MDDDGQHLSTLVSSAALVVLGGLVSAGGTLVERVVIGRMLSPDAYGEVNLALTLMMMCTTIALLGFSQGVPRYLSRFDTPESKRGVWASGVLVSVGTALLIAAVLFVGAESVAGLLFDSSAAPALIRAFALSLPFVVGLNIAIGGIRGMENTLYKTYTKDLFYPIFRILLIVVFLGLGLGVMAAGYAYVIAGAVSFLVAHLLLNKLLPLLGEFELRLSELLRFSAPLVIATLLAMLLLRTDTLMLGYFRSSFDVGQYSAAYPLGRGMLILLNAFGFMYLPLASSLDADGKRDEIDSIYATTTKWIYIGTFPAFAAMVFFPEDLLRIFFGAEYTPAGIALMILAIGFFSNAIGGRNRETLVALGQTKYVMVANGVTFALNVALNVLLIPGYGFVGAAVASAVSIVFMNSFVCALLKYRFDITPFSRWSVRTYGLVPVALVPPIYLLSRHVELTAMTVLPFLLVTGMAVLAVVTAVDGLQPEDRILVDFLESKTGFEVPLVHRYLPRD